MYKYFILILIILTGCKEKKIEKSNQISRTPKILKQSPSSNLTKEKLLNDKNVIPFLNEYAKDWSIWKFLYVTRSILIILYFIEL